MAKSTRDPRELDGAWQQHQQHTFALPCPDLAGYVERFWTAEWEYATPYQQKIVPYPNVHLTARDGSAPEVHGVSSRHVFSGLEGRGRVIGAAFWPGVFRQVLGCSVSSITDRTVPAAAVALLRPAPAAIDDSVHLERWLLEVLPEPDPRGQEVREMVALIQRDTSVARVDVLATIVGTGVRRLQRLFAEHVGVGPKWVIRRYRLHEVTERMSTGVPIEWAALAADLGYSDQAHLTRDFTDLFGESPTAYARRYPQRLGP